MYPFERFTEGAKQVLTLAQDEAEKSPRSYIGTEDLLLALLRQGDGLAARVLANLGVSEERARNAVGALQGPVEQVMMQQIIPTSRVKKVIETAFEEAKRMNNTYVGTEHILLGLLIYDDAFAATVLAHLGVTLELVRDELARVPAEPRGEGVADLSSESAVPVTRHGFGIGRAFQRRWEEAFGSVTDFPESLSELSAEARSVLALAEEECLAAGGLEVNSLDLLLAILRHGRCRAAAALKGCGLSEERLRAVPRPIPAGEHPMRLRLSDLVREAVVQPGSGPPGRPRDTAEILESLLTDSNSEATRVLGGCGTSAEALRAELKGPPGRGLPGA